MDFATEIYEELCRFFNSNQAKLLTKYLEKSLNKKEEKLNCRYVTREEIRELDRISIEEYKIPGIMLMENAGRGAAIEILKRIPQKPVSIICGKGNNGGDGFVIARHLHNNKIPVKVFVTCSLNDISLNSDPGVNLTILKNMGIIPIEIKNLDEFNKNKSQIKNSCSIVDAILGTGIKGEIKSPLCDIIKEIEKLNKLVFAIDIPSGIDANTGEILGVAIHSYITLTFGLPKKGFLEGEAPQYTGEVKVVDISIPLNLLEQKRET